MHRHHDHRNHHRHDHHHPPLPLFVLVSLARVRCRDDPPAPSLRGVARWDFVEGAERPVFEGLKRFCELVDSPYHGA